MWYRSVIFHPPPHWSWSLFRVYNLEQQIKWNHQFHHSITISFLAYRLITATSWSSTALLSCRGFWWSPQRCHRCVSDTAGTICCTEIKYLLQNSWHHLMYHVQHSLLHYLSHFILWYNTTCMLPLKPTQKWNLKKRTASPSPFPISSQQQPGGPTIGDLSITQALGMARDQVLEKRCTLLYSGLFIELCVFLEFCGVL
jgi:hypothetical protein